VNGRVHPNGQGDDNCDDQRKPHQQDGISQPADDEVQHVFSHRNRPGFAPIPLNHLGQPAHITALVEAAGFFDLPDLRAVLAGQQRFIEIEQRVQPIQLRFGHARVG